MTLKSLEGQHIFTGVDLYLQDPACVVFELDGTVYEAVENPSDGYRSYMEELTCSCARIRNKIPPISVICKHVSNNEGYVDMTHDLLTFIDPENGKTFLTIGTKYVNDYYPYCTFEYHPELLHINQHLESNQKPAETKKNSEKEKKSSLVWNVYTHDVNTGALKIYNIFENENFLNSILKEAAEPYSLLIPDYNRFKECVEKKLKYYFCKRCERELIVSPWPPCETNKGEKIDVYDQVMLNFDQFYNYLYNWIKMSGDFSHQPVKI